MEDADAGQENVVLTAIAKTDSILELISTIVDIEAHLQKLLPTFGQEQLMRLFEKGGELTQLDDEQDDGYKSVASQIPAPDRSILKLWRHMCVSRYPRASASLQEQHFIPTVQLLEAAWKSAFAAYNIRAGGMGDMKKIDFEDDGEGVDEMVQVKAAVWNYLVSDDGSSLDREKTVTWVLRTLWEFMSTSAKMATIQNSTELEDFWRDQLPREWKTAVTIDKLEAGTYEIYTDGGINMCRWTEKSRTTPIIQAVTAKPGKRKWHEKFRESRNVKA